MKELPYSCFVIADSASGFGRTLVRFRAYMYGTPKPLTVGLRVEAVVSCCSRAEVGVRQFSRMEVGFRAFLFTKCRSLSK